MVERSNSSCIRSHGAKGRRFESRAFLFLLFVSKPESRRGVRHEKKRKSTKVTRNEERWRARERREEEEEEPAGGSGMVTRIGLVRFEDD